MILSPKREMRGGSSPAARLPSQQANSAVAQNQLEVAMGDKSPKSKQKEKNQKSAAKSQAKNQQAKRQAGFASEAGKEKKK